MDNMDNIMGICIEHADEIGVSDDQIDKLRPVHSEMQKKQARFRADMKISEIELKEITEVKDFDLEKATYSVKRIAAIKTAHTIEMLRAMKELRANLTNEQFKTIRKMMFP